MQSKAWTRTYMELPVHADARRGIRISGGGLLCRPMATARLHTFTQRFPSQWKLPVNYQGKSISNHPSTITSALAMSIHQKQHTRTKIGDTFFFTPLPGGGAGGGRPPPGIREPTGMAGFTNSPSSQSNQATPNQYQRFERWYRDDNEHSRSHIWPWDGQPVSCYHQVNHCQQILHSPCGLTVHTRSGPPGSNLSGRRGIIHVQIERPRSFSER